MASTSLQYDSCTYEEKLRRSVGPGLYMVNTPSNDCQPCAQDITGDPYYRFQAWGANTCPPGSAVDDSSELLGLNYKTSKCSTSAYAPGKYPSSGKCSVPGAKTNPRSCAPPTEDTRLSNPPCTLRSTGWNRWEWLCWNPQDRAIVPFDFNVNYRMVAKDNHVPCIPNPEDATNYVGAGDRVQSDFISNWKPPASCGAQAPGNGFTTVQRTCDEVSRM